MPSNLEINSSNFVVKVPYPRGQEEFSFSIKDEVIRENLTLLFNRQAGTKFYVENQKLCKVEGLKGKFLAWWQGPEKISAVVSRALCELSPDLKRLKDSQVSRFVSHFFSRKGAIGRLSPKIFNRDDFKKGDPLSAKLIGKNILRLKIGQDHYFDIESDQITQGTFLDIDLGEKVVNDNLYCFLKRKKGHKFSEKVEVIAEAAKTIIGELGKYLKSQKEITLVHEIAIQKILTEGAFQRLNGYLFRQAIELASKEPNKQEAKKIREALNPFSGIAEGSNIEKILLTPAYLGCLQKFKASLYALRDNGKNAATLRELEETLIDLVIAEFEYVQQLGADLEANKDGGSGGARYARNRFGEKILVIKPGDEGPYGVNNPNLWARMKQLVLSQKRSLDGNSEPLAEVESRLLDRVFGLFVVPPTTLHHVTSKQFNGQERKECSIQMFVDGCKPLGEHVGISSRLYRLPRFVLRGWLAGERKEGILQTLPQNAMKRAALHDALTGNTDCHLDNILVKIKATSDSKSTIEKLFDGDKVENEEIEAFVSEFFKNNNHQALLETFLYSEKNTNGERVWNIKHDGGSSCGHSQPRGMSLAMKYLFEVMPHFEEAFQTGDAELLVGKEEQFVKALAESAIQSFKNVLDSERFLKFWKVEENRALFKEWLFETNDEFEMANRTKLLKTLWKIKKDLDIDQWINYFDRHLVRIGGNFVTRTENWRVLMKYLKMAQKYRQNPANNGKVSQELTMRYFFYNVRSLKDFQREQATIEVCMDGFSDRMKEWKTKPVKKGDANYSDAKFDMRNLLKDFGID